MDRYLAARLARIGIARIGCYRLHSLTGASWDILDGLLSMSDSDPMEIAFGRNGAYRGRPTEVYKKFNIK